jgi:hypothetical protein
VKTSKPGSSSEELENSGISEGGVQVVGKAKKWYKQGDGGPSSGKTWKIVIQAGEWGSYLKNILFA